MRGGSGQSLRPGQIGAEGYGVRVCVTNLFTSIFYILHDVHLAAGLSLGGLGLRGVHGYCLGYKQIL